MRELKESGGIGLAPTDWKKKKKKNWQTGTWSPRSLDFNSLEILVMWRPEGSSVRSGGTRFLLGFGGIERVKFTKLSKVVIFLNTCQKMRFGKQVKVKKRQRQDILGVYGP